MRILKILVFLDLLFLQAIPIISPQLFILKILKLSVERSEHTYIASQKFSYEHFLTIVHLLSFSHLYKYILVTYF